MVDPFFSAMSNPNVDKTNIIKSVFVNKTDEEIWQLFISGDTQAFIFLYDKYFNILFRYGRQFTSDKEMIKDVIQDLFIDFRTSRYKVSRSSSRYYLFKCLKNNLILKIKKRSKFVDFNSGSGYQFDFSISQEQKIIDIQLKEEEVIRLNKAISKLTTRQKEAIYYLFYQNFSVDEVQKMMQLDNRRSVQNIVYKALSQLKESLLLVLTWGFISQ